MGTYLNPGDSGFRRILSGEYVDKTGIVGLVNAAIGTPHNLVCVSRPRRFGKSYAAQALCAYYDRTCDSRALFAGLEASATPGFEEHLNAYDVIYLDMTGVIGETAHDDVAGFARRSIEREIALCHPEVRIEEGFSSTLANLVGHTGRRIVAIIDEWDAPIRESPETARPYLEFLRSLFKNSGVTAKVFAAAYMTGILPIKKDGSQSAISDFDEFTMVRPRMFARYVGLTEGEVRALCEAHGADFSEMRRWYDGYELSGTGHVYNPNSVMSALRFGEFDSYWAQSSAAESLMGYIGRDFDGLARTVAGLLGGVEVEVDTRGFSNDLTSLRCADDVLTLLVHLGYLAYDPERGVARIPNEEVRREFQRSVREVRDERTRRRLEESDRLFADTLAGDEEAVAAQIQKVHAEETSPLHYNREDSLRSVIKLAYYTYRDHYLQFEEMPAGVGYADVVYLPRRDSPWPALFVELKWDEAAESAIDQIRERGYAEALSGFGGDVLLVGISYDKASKRHECHIERLDGRWATQGITELASNARWRAYGQRG